MEPIRLPRRVVAVRGPDARPFLDGLLTNSVSRVAPGRPVYAALLSPQGKILTDMIVWDDPDGLLLDAPEARAEDLIRRLKLFKLRAKVEIAETALAVVAGMGDTPDPRLAALGTRALTAEAPPVDEGAAWSYALTLIRQGVPDLAFDAEPESIFALEGLLEELNGVDFKKGCFVGQENVSRMKRRATTRRKFCRIGYEDWEPEIGAPIRAGGVQIGEMRSGALGRGLAFLRLDRALEAERNGVQLTADRHPWEAGDPPRTKPIWLDPPDWLILPVEREEGAN